ncbi:MAG TPA: prolyl oligopeptidase family serine peptidase [Tepidisphaeraceae bacterium]|nr:prolyl oligopeptidase family serine peptidase [Tepidisphaeraceae bacterium]
MARSTAHAKVKTGFVERRIVVDGAAHSIWVFIPTNYDPKNLYPAILFLHGLFEEGNGGTNVLSAGLGPVIARNPDKWPFVTIFPQSDGDWKGDKRDRLAMAALDDAQKHYAIHPDRVILAGLSFGGLGVWDIGSQHTDRFAALVPVSGPADVEVANKVMGLPVWAFASKDDPFVPAANSEAMCQTIQTHGGRAQLTEFDGNQHDCWVMAVDKSSVVDWMLNQMRNSYQVTAKSNSVGGKVQLSGKLKAWDEP